MSNANTRSSTLRRRFTPIFEIKQCVVDFSTTSNLNELSFFFLCMQGKPESIQCTGSTEFTFQLSCKFGERLKDEIYSTFTSSKSTLQLMSKLWFAEQLNSTRKSAATTAAVVWLVIWFCGVRKWCKMNSARHPFPLQQNVFPSEN